MNKKTYKAVFEAQATVQLEVTVIADNQQEGIVSAHDVAAQVGMANARIVHVDGEPVNISFEQIPLEPEAANANKNLTGYRVLLSENGLEGADQLIIDDLDEGTACRIARTVQGEACPFGVGIVIAPWGNEVLRVTAEYGGWEVHFKAAENFQYSINSWLPSKIAAFRRAKELLGYGHLSSLKIVDFTNRKKGRITVREIQ